MWYAIIAAALAASLGGLIYVSFRAARFGFIRRALRGNRVLSVAVSAVFFALLTGVIWLLWGLVNALICLIHLAVFWAIADGVAFLISKIGKKEKPRSYAGAAAILFTVTYLTYGWIAAHNVTATAYSFTSPKADGKLRLVQISDSHIGALFHADRFREYVQEINALKPDLVAVTGDFVDDDTSREDMLGACAALGDLKTTYGVFFVYGNHDKGYYGAERRGWSSEELRNCLTNYGVVILEDEAREIGTSFTIAGRIDRAAGERTARKTARELLSGLDRGRYIILLDHQPADFDGEAEAGVDLVLCGHTHGGQFFPVNEAGKWLGANDLTYGHERRQNTDFIVSSGIGCWAFKFKTGCISEYTVVEILPA